MTEEPNKALAVRYRLGGLFKKNESILFSEIESVQSCARFTGDNDAKVELELRLRNQRRLVLKSMDPDWESVFCLGLSGCIEPTQIRELRDRVVSVTGTKDLGFYRPQPL